jgi:XisI protein
MVLSRFFIPIVHLDVRDGKVWIQHNATEEEIADDLMGLGIEAQLGMHRLSLRPCADFEGVRSAAQQSLQVQRK